MIENDKLLPITPTGGTFAPSAAHVSSGLPIPPTLRVQVFSPDEWEEFAAEYATSLSDEYTKVRRYGGSGDMGIDVACFISDIGFADSWDNYQCKRYAAPLRPSDIWVEIGKIIYYSFRKEYPIPRKHFFCASKGIGTKLEMLLNDATKLKDSCREVWSEKCECQITSTQLVPLTEDFLVYFNNFDFTIFSSKSVLELISGHSKTQYHTIRFGGGLPQRLANEPPPKQPKPEESRYIKKLLAAYGDKEGKPFKDAEALAENEFYTKNYQRQRERFYNAEALRNFARDTVPEGTFSQLKEEIYHGVVEDHEADHANGFDRMSAVVKQAGTVVSTSNPLTPVTSVSDRQGICHQLANDDRLEWVSKND